VIDANTFLYSLFLEQSHKIRNCTLSNISLYDMPNMSSEITNGL